MRVVEYSTTYWSIIFPAADGTPYHMMVVNASNREKIVNWINSKIPSTSDS